MLGGYVLFCHQWQENRKTRIEYGIALHLATLAIDLPSHCRFGINNLDPIALGWQGRVANARNDNGCPLRARSLIGRYPIVAVDHRARGCDRQL